MDSSSSNTRLRTSRATRDLVVFSHLRWSFVWQRPQHLISRLGAKRRTWFIEEPMPAPVEEPRLRVEEAGPVTRVWLEVPGEQNHHFAFDHPAASGYLDELKALFQEEGLRTEPLVWLYTPMALPMAEELNPGLLIYDVMDDLSAFRHSPDGLQERHQQALARAGMVFAGGRSLYEGLGKQHNQSTFLFASGVEPEHYQAGMNASKTSDRPVAGYVGVIDERLDLELIQGLADALPEWNIEMVGPTLKIDTASLPQASNLKYRGQQPYEKLPELMGAFDVALMPFALNEATRSISPTKTLEYLAGGLPVVSTRVPDVVADYATAVNFQDDAEGFASACRKLLSDSPEEREAKVKPLLKLHHWDAIADRMEQLIQTALDGGQPAGGSANPSSNGPGDGAYRLGEQQGFDFMIVGAGYAGSVLAERLATQAGKRVLMVEKRNHIAGNAFDCYDEAGVLVHKYGPHIFHTNSREVFDYLSQFTSWRQYEHRVLASVDGMLVPIPINLETVNQLYGLNLTSLEVEDFFKSAAEPVAHCRTSEDVVVSKVGRELYNKFFRNYTRKQWGLDPSELEAAVAGRVPVRTNRDGRYFTDQYQAMPRHGYTKMFENMLSHPNIKVMLNTDYREVRRMIPFKEMVYTGPIDEYFDLRYGKLPYRSLEFQFETHDIEVRQPAAVINYPNEHPYTRVTEFKYLTGQQHPKTTLVFEHPRATGDPYYPVPRSENADLFKRYKALGDKVSGVHFVGRLATYKYYNMDQVVAQALALYNRLSSSREARTTESQLAMQAGGPAA